VDKSEVFTEGKSNIKQAVGLRIPTEASEPEKATLEKRRVTFAVGVKPQ
jgi:hypothetical protein